MIESIYQLANTTHHFPGANTMNNNVRELLARADKVFFDLYRPGTTTGRIFGKKRNSLSTKMNVTALLR